MTLSSSAMSDHLSAQASTSFTPISSRMKPGSLMFLSSLLLCQAKLAVGQRTLACPPPPHLFNATISISKAASPGPVISAVVVRRQLGDEKREFLGHLYAHVGFPDHVRGAVCE